MTAYLITPQIPPLIPPDTRTSHINRAFNAALAEFLALEGGASYGTLYEKYMNIAPRFRPTGRDCDAWSDVDENNDALQQMFARGTLRIGYVAGAPYVYYQNGALTGFDFELAGELTQIIAKHYGKALTPSWEPVVPDGGDQADKLKKLYQGLVGGTFDLALAGQMMLPTAYLSGLPIEWTAPTAMLFTNISWTGRDRDKLDVIKLEALRGGDLDAFIAYAVAETQRINLELRIFTVVNPGPSPKAGQDLCYAINSKKGRSVWDCGDVSDSDAVMYEAVDHFAVGDSLASGMQAGSPGFDGIYLDVPANDELWPIAGFTAGKTVPSQPQIAVYAEHSDSMKPMVLDPDVHAGVAGWNVRVFNRTEVRIGDTIHLEHGTGVVTLGPGLHHITASSIVTYDDLAGTGHVLTKIDPFAGYCRLRYADMRGCDNEDAIAIGTMSTANMVPSLLETWLDVKDRARVVLEHQVGPDVANLYLEGTWAKSSWHAFARIAIRRL